MKLLQPRELNTKLQDQKKSEIDAGLFLAKKIDRLREELQEAQVEHDKGIQGMKLEYESFLSKSVEQRGKIAREIKESEEKLIELRKPLDAEWEEVRKQTKSNQELKESLDHTDSTLIKKDFELVRKSDELDKREEWIKDNETRTSQLLQKAKEDYQEAQDILINAKENETEIKEALKVRTEAISKRETDVAYREIDVENRNKNALAKEEANRKETLHIESKQRQLSAAFAELEKRNGTAHNTNG